MAESYAPIFGPDDQVTLIPTPKAVLQRVDCLDCGEIQYRIIHEDQLVYCRECGSECLTWRPA